ncbi:D-alanyl-D-alanine carboxypeptidase family protein [Ampullimonas aquatilis]|uniref:D-alanyl-D-alanine carboxypeptidase family protein n=1 Tax=Ampullimonas aquatilis TaxID=1341549 RepID=UPI003C78B307
MLKKIVSFVSAASLTFALALPSAQAQVAAPAVAAKAWLLIDMNSGQTLTSQEPDMRVEPASLTKLMTAYLSFSALKEKKITLDQMITPSKNAYKPEGSRMFIDIAKPVSVDDLLHGMIIQSGNDASIALAELIGGSEAAFAELMNREAKSMGMNNTNFKNSTGLPDPSHYSTANDLAKLVIRLITDFPEQYGLYSIKEFTYNNIKQPNRNRLLFMDPTVDGVKTGHTDAAGFCLISSAHRPLPNVPNVQRRLLSVVLGTTSDAARAVESQKLLNFGFSAFDDVRVYEKNQVLGTPEVWKGKLSNIKIGLKEDLYLSVPKGQADSVKATLDRTQPLLAPLQQGDQVGVLRVEVDGKPFAERPVVALETVETAGFFGRLWDTIRLWFK